MKTHIANWTRIAVGLILLATATAVRALEQSEIASLLNEGNELFRQANQKAAVEPQQAIESYGKAVLRFERIVNEGGIENGGLYYNIGNAYFRMKDIGRAILNYRRAQRYIPNDPNLRQNLAYARARRSDSIEERQQMRVLKTLFFWHYDLSTRTRARLFMIAFGLLWGCALARLFVRRPTLSRLIWLFFLAAGFMAGSLTTELVHDRKVRPGVIVAGEVVARKGDSETYEPSFKDPLHAGTEFVLVEDRKDWYQVDLMDGRKCWVPAVSVGMVR
jgi:hypothetical protein